MDISEYRQILTDKTMGFAGDQTGQLRKSKSVLLHWKFPSGLMESNQRQVSGRSMKPASHMCVFLRVTNLP